MEAKEEEEEDNRDTFLKIIFDKLDNQRVTQHHVTYPYIIYGNDIYTQEPTKEYPTWYGKMIRGMANVGRPSLRCKKQVSTYFLPLGSVFEDIRSINFIFQFPFFQIYTLI